MTHWLWIVIQSLQIAQKHYLLRVVLTLSSDGTPLCCYQLQNISMSQLSNQLFTVVMISDVAEFDVVYGTVLFTLALVTLVCGHHCPGPAVTLVHTGHTSEAGLGHTVLCPLCHDMSTAHVQDYSRRFLPTKS